ncbi:MAG: VCBS repeat-containing protein, partial [Verrucomicrobia bacterium]|nr:VCBS repeat-containing protein [Verrucomicrobiota bacterium]
GDGTFTRVETGSLVNDAGHSVACGWADFDNNGFLDLFVGNLQGETNFLYRSNGNANHWLKFKVVGTTSNRSGIGAKVRVAANIRGAVLLQLREISAGSGHNGGELIAHFGLGDARTADAVRVEWPSGKVQELTNVAADQFMTLTEPEGNLPLAVRTHPKDTFAGIGETADLFVTATGPAPLRFQWLRDGQPLPGATNQLLTLSPVQRTAEGDYSAIVNGAGNSLTSRVAHLTIDPFTRVSGPISEIGGSRGGAWADYDKDGDQDLLVWNGGAVRKSNYLFRNDGNAGFIRITEGPVAGDTSDHHSAAWADLDNDGDLDLFSANFDDDPNDLFRNNGNGSFERAGPGTEENDFAGFGGASWADYDNDGLVDLFIANSRGRPHALYRNAGNGSLSKVTTGEIPGAGADSRGAAWSDYDQDGRMDLFVATGDGKNFLFQNQGNGAFVNESRSVVETGEAVGGVWGDYNNDGRPDLLVVSEVEANTLFRNEGNGVFSPVSVEDIATNPIGSLGAVFGDYDNDGFLDLFVAGAGRNALYRNTGDGSFTWIADTQIVTVDGLSFQASWADYDNDGFLDLFVANGGHLLDIPNALFRNNGNGNHWVKFRLTGTKSNRAAIGAKIRVQARIGGKDLPQIREITGGDGYSNTQPLEAHFGLGDADRIDTVRIEWPSGKVQELRNVAANQILTITEQDSAPQLAVTLQGGELKFSLSAEPNSSYRIEISPDLKTWSTLTTVSIPAAGSAGTFTDRLQAGQAARFYRAVRP